MGLEFLLGCRRPENGRFQPKMAVSNKETGRFQTTPLLVFQNDREQELQNGRISAWVLQAQKVSNRKRSVSGPSRLRVQNHKMALEFLHVCPGHFFESCFFHPPHFCLCAIGVERTGNGLSCATCKILEAT